MIPHNNINGMGDEIRTRKGKTQRILSPSCRPIPTHPYIIKSQDLNQGVHDHDLF